MHPDAIHAREIKLAIHYAAYEGPDGKQAAMATAGILAACFVHGCYQVVGRAPFARIPVWRGPRCLSPSNACGYLLGGRGFRQKHQVTKAASLGSPQP